MKRLLIDLPMATIGGLLFLLGFSLCIIIQHIRWDWRFWTGWREELSFWLTGAFSLMLLVILLPFGAYWDLTDTRPD